MNALKSIYRSFFPTEMTGEEMSRVKATVEVTSFEPAFRIFRMSLC